MSWDTTSHTEQNDHAEGTMPMYAGIDVIGTAGNFALPDGRHNALRWHEFSRATALIAEPLAQYTREPRYGLPVRFGRVEGSDIIDSITGVRYTVETPQEPDDDDRDEVELADREDGAQYIARIESAEAQLNG